MSTVAFLKLYKYDTRFCACQEQEVFLPLTAPEKEKENEIKNSSITCASKASAQLRRAWRRCFNGSKA